MDTQNATYQDVIFAILEAIDFTEDKNKFVEKFIMNTQMQTFLDLVETLSPEKQEEIKKQLEQGQNDPQKTAEIINSFFDQTQMQKAFEDAAKNEVTEWMKAIDHTLTPSQRERLMKLGLEFQKMSSTTSDY